MARTCLMASLLAGAAFDLVFAVGVLYLPGPLSRMVGLPLPEEMVWIRLCAVLLVILAMFYLVAATALDRAPELVAVAAAGRLLGFLFFLRVWLLGSGDPFLVFGLLDLALAASHGGLLILLKPSPAPGEEGVA